MFARSHAKPRSAVLVAVLSVCFCGTSLAAVEYRLTDLADLFGPEFVTPYPNAINDAGAIAGFYSRAGNSRPFIYQNGALTDFDPDPGASTSAQDINNAGQAVALRQDPRWHSYVYSNGAITDLPDPAVAEDGALAKAISSGGVVVGSYRHTPSGSPFDEWPVQWRNGVPTQVPTPGGTGAGAATGVNAAGAIAGTYYPGEDHLTAARGFVYRNGVATAIGTLGGEGSFANAINNLGQVVGGASTPTAVHAFLYTPDGQLIDLGAIGDGTSYANALNDAGAVVGAYTSPDGQVSSAFIYRDGQMVDLNTLIDPATAGGLRLTNAFDINNAGQIVGIGLRDEGGGVGYLLTPVPEPSAAAVLGLFGMFLAARRRRP